MKGSTVLTSLRAGRKKLLKCTSIFLQDKMSASSGQKMFNYFIKISFLRQPMTKCRFSTLYWASTALVRQCKITCKYLNWRAEDESLMTSEASLSARLAFCSPSAAITLARASRAASASAAIALWSWTGKRTSFLWIFRRFGWKMAVSSCLLFKLRG